MATTHYSFPTINGTDTIDGVNAINGLANAVDAALYNVEQNEGGYTLPAATTNRLGGVIVGQGLTAQSDGTLSIGAATQSSLGGVRVGSGLTINGSGVLSVTQQGGITPAKTDGTTTIAGASTQWSVVNVPEMNFQVIHVYVGGMENWQANNTYPAFYTLPAGRRPSYNQRYLLMAGADFAIYLNINTSGACSIQTQGEGTNDPAGPVIGAVSVPMFYGL